MSPIGQTGPGHAQCYTVKLLPEEEEAKGTPSSLWKYQEREIRCYPSTMPHKPGMMAKY
jgi:hypothetical protein